MANSRNYKKGWLVDDRFTDLSLDGKSALLPLFDKADDLGLIVNPKIALRGQAISDTALQELVDAGYLLRIEDNKRTFYLFREWSGNQHLRHFQLGGIFNQLLIPNLFVDNSGLTIYKDNLIDQNQQFINNHQLLIENVYQSSANFAPLIKWQRENKNIIGSTIEQRLITMEKDGGHSKNNTANS
ncbi:hypothetical protein R5R51_02035 [Oenococcus oeni]|uniref:Uncharacterized protein n=1 Tax=Oenococcus oeni TaxID=1247 RepID=A1IMI5_OENOE|nr:hypothetical protein [Oenococcus oeni]EJO03703.1 hypothetical protein AWRIB422_1777 [Oenococcus oeni AWRIB422]KGH56702.1 hypothetical protein X463_01625 [Oenococcus oeni S22]KGI05275.1 hypothetical protein X297_07075 [Oenococcus oeni IOEB_L40_4]KMQ38896.1 phage protein [Oenococcus oeni]OIK63046.1 hypothetical protein ATW63_00425 [Oenococcus oeni]